MWIRQRRRRRRLWHGKKLTWLHTQNSQKETRQAGKLCTIERRLKSLGAENTLQNIAITQQTGKKEHCAFDSEWIYMLINIIISLLFVIHFVCGDELFRDLSANIVASFELEDLRNYTKSLSPEEFLKKDLRVLKIAWVNWVHRCELSRFVSRRLVVLENCCELFIYLLISTEQQQQWLKATEETRKKGNSRSII